MTPPPPSTSAQPSLANLGRGALGSGAPVCAAVPGGPLLLHRIQAGEPVVRPQLLAGLAGRLRLCQNGLLLCPHTLDTEGEMCD